MRWPSPWGDGFPGWHLECTAMSTKYLGTHFDIHGGGMDLKFPHHECEIAQNEACTGQTPVNFWMHANMLTLNGKKMSKSTGNNILPGEILTGDNPFLSKAFSASVARFFMLQAHYRSNLDFSDEAILAAEKGYNRLMEAVESLKNIDDFSFSDASSTGIKSWIDKCYDAMNDDFNAPILIAQLFEGVKIINLLKEKSVELTKTDFELFRKSINEFVFDVLGLNNENAISNNKNNKLDDVVNLLISLRKQARDNKNFELSDQIRDQLLAIGIQLKDGKEATIYSVLS